ncbi:MAG: GUN4 domain-containing protein [Symploca sp. SIO2E9]|nr:GUN4 domain-containing protein [Symploca sp. SIO2E9]
MKKFYLLALLGTLGVLYLSPTLAQSPRQTNPITTESTQEAANIDSRYSQLQGYLKQQDWEAADQETYELMLKIAGSNSEKQGSFDLTEWQNFSCSALKQIDKLWLEASDGRLGFSTQNKILEEVQDYNVFYFRIGWKRQLLKDEWGVAWEYNQETQKAEYITDKKPNFEQPPDGHLPAKLEWETNPGDSPKDRRFEAIYRCNL